jgi:hypothetical protein
MKNKQIIKQNKQNKQNNKRKQNNKHRNIHFGFPNSYCFKAVFRVMRF